MNSCAVVTMVYNEEQLLPRWVNYYASQFGKSACYIIDHGSDDGSTCDLGAINVLRIPRSPMHDKKRANFISLFCSSLLEWYRIVIYTDVDEFLVPDPEDYTSLADFCSRASIDTINAVGLNIIHQPDTEPPFDPSLPVIGQRRWARFSFPMCKPIITSVPIKWTPGFHSSDHAMRFDRVFLFHLHNFDLSISLRRLAKTRAMPWGDGPPDHYQKWSDDQHEKVLRAQASLPKVESTTLRRDDPHILKYTQWALQFVVANPDKKHLFYYNNGIPCLELLKIPDRFFGHV